MLTVKEDNWAGSPVIDAGFDWPVEAASSVAYYGEAGWFNGLKHRS